MKKRLLCIVCAVLLLGGLNISLPASGAESAESKFLVFSKALGLLDETADGAQAVTRAELARTIARLTGYEEPEVENPLKYTPREGSVAQYDYQRISGRPIFKDVPQSHWAVGYIEHAALGGYLRGTAADKYIFAPDDPAACTDGYEAMLKLLGYQPFIERKGGGTTGIIGAAQEAGILVSGGVNLTVDSLAQLLYKTMRAEMLEMTGISVSGGQIDYRRTRPYMEYAFDMHAAERVRVEANSVTSLTGGAACGEGKARIGGMSFYDENSLSVPYIGYLCDVYYIQEDNSSERYIKVMISRAEEPITVKPDEVEYITRDSFRYEREGSIQTERLSPVLNVIYNNQLLDTWDPAGGLIADGSYQLIDTDGNGDIDLLYIKAYQYMVVRNVLAGQEKVTGAYRYNGDGMGLDSIDLSDFAGGVEQRVWYTMKGQPAALTDIRPGAVLSVLRGTGSAPRAVEVDISYSTLNGDADALSTEEGIMQGGVKKPDVVYLGTTSYKLTSAFYSSGGQISPGDAGTFYLTKTNKIFAFEKSGVSGLLYGYLKDVGKTNGLDETYLFRMFTAEGEWAELEAAERIKANNSSGKAEQMLVNSGIITLTNGEISNVAAQLVRYRTNGTKLTELQTVQTDLTGITDIDVREAALRTAASNGEFRLCHSGDMRFYGSQQNLDWKVILTKPCPTFLVPDNPRTASEDSFAMRDNNFFEYNTPYPVWSYDENTFGQPGALVVSAGSGAGGAAPSKYIFMADKLSEAVNTVGDEVFTAGGCYRGNSVQYPITDALLSQKGMEAIQADFRAGNALKIALSAKDEIENYEVLYDPRVQKEFLKVSDYTSSSNYVYGRVLDVDLSSKFVRVRGSAENDGLDSVRNFWVSVTNPFTVIYDGKTGRVTKGSFADLEADDYLVIRMEDIKPTVFFIYRNAF